VPRPPLFSSPPFFFFLPFSPFLSVRGRSAQAAGSSTVSFFLFFFVLPPFPIRQKGYEGGAMNNKKSSSPFPKKWRANKLPGFNQQARPVFSFFPSFPLSCFFCPPWSCSRAASVCWPEMLGGICHLLGSICLIADKVRRPCCLFPLFLFLSPFFFFSLFPSSPSSGQLVVVMT